MITCPECGHENEDAALDCANCRRNLQVVQEKSAGEGQATQEASPDRSRCRAPVTRRPIQVARAVPFLLVCVSLCGPWYITDFGDVGAGWLLGLDLSGWTCGLCGIPYMLLILTGLGVILNPGRPAIRRWYPGIVWTYRATLLLWLVAMTTNFWAMPFGWKVDWSGYWGPKLFIISLAVAVFVEVVAIIVELYDKSRVTVEDDN